MARELSRVDVQIIYKHGPAERDELPKIYIFKESQTHDTVYGYALAQDGRMLASHLCSSAEWVRYDMGLTSEKKHSSYWCHYPGGFALVDLVDMSFIKLAQHDGFAAAMYRNKELWDAEEAKNPHS